MAKGNETVTKEPRSRVAGADRSRRGREKPEVPSGTKRGGKRGEEKRDAAAEPAAVSPTVSTESAPAPARQRRARAGGRARVEAAGDAGSGPTQGEEGAVATVPTSTDTAAVAQVAATEAEAPIEADVGVATSADEIGASEDGGVAGTGVVSDAATEAAIDAALDEVFGFADGISGTAPATDAEAPEQTAVLAPDMPAPAASSDPAVLLQPEPQNVMEVGLKPQDVKAGLAAVVAGLPGKASLPVLHCIMIETDGPEHVRLTATDLDTTVTRRIAATVSEPGAVLVAGKKFHEIVREIPDGCVVNLRLKEDTLHVSCQATRTRYKLPTIPRDEFPTPPGIQWDGNAFGIDGAMLALMIERTGFATSTEETRPILNGVLWEFSDEDMGMVATNGHRLSGTHLALDTGSGHPEMIIHPRALGMVARLPAEGEVVQVARTENHVGFRGDGWEIITRLMAGPYPDYRQVLPKDNDKWLVADKAALTAALRRMVIVASEQTHRVKFTLGEEPTLMRISVESADLGTAEEYVAVEYEGDPLEIGFNALYLLELLRYCPAGEVRMTLKAPERAATIVPVDDSSGARTEMLVMPLRLL
jgi:DNA polymerase-3 subunit beta